MNQNLTELVCIIDRSTSIKTNGLIKSTIEGFNSLLEKQKNEPGMAKMTVVLFDGDRYNPQYAYDIIHDGVDINLVKELNEYDYVPRGMTALYDAIGKTIDTIKTRQMNTPNDERASKIIVAILTDGEENSSVEYNKETIKTMIEELEREHGWVFLFLGAGIDAMSAGVNIGISKSNTLSFNSTDFETKNTYLRLNTVISRTRGLSNAHYNASKSDLMSVIYETTDDDQ